MAKRFNAVGALSIVALLCMAPPAGDIDNSVVTNTPVVYSTVSTGGVLGK